MKKPKVVLDTNIFVSALLLPASKPHKILRLWQEDKFVLLISPETFEEIMQVLNRDKLKKKYKIDKEKIDKLINEIIEHAQFILPSIEINVCRNRVLCQTSESATLKTTTVPSETLVTKR